MTHPLARSLFRCTTLAGALVVVAPLLVVTAARAGSVTFDVKEGGDVKWTSQPCTADIYPAEGADAVKSDASTASPIDVDAGKWEAVIACASDEGTVKQSVAFAIGPKGSDIKVPVDVEPGFLLVNVTRDNKQVSAQIAVFDERSRQVAASKDRAVFPVPSGKLRVLAKVEDAGDHAIFGNASAVVKAKEKSTVLVDTTDGELLVTLTDNGRKAGGVVALRQPGQKTRLVELHAGEKGSAPPGTYDLVTQLDDTHDFSEVVTKNVVIAPAKLTTKSVNHSTASIKVNVLVDGKAPPAGAKIDVELGNPGASAPFNTASAGDTLKVAGGTFEISAVEKDVARDDGTTPKATQKVTVHAGEARALTLDIESAKLDVTTEQGGKAKSLEVDILAPGNDAPLTQKTTDADGKATFVLSAGKFIARAIAKAPQGDVVTAHDVTLALGSRVGLKLNVDVGTAVVQVFEDGVSVPAEVRFFKDDGKPIDAKKPPAGDPMLAVPAGQDALLPPGSYVLVVVRNGDTHVYSALKVASGRTVERSVDLKK